MTATNDLSVRHGDKMLGSSNSTRPEAMVEIDLGTYGQTPAGKKHYRGLPCFPPSGSIDGTMAGTQPEQALLDKAEELGW